jgi:hypothetical protein
MNASMFFLNGVVAKVTTGVAIIAVAAGGVQAVEKYELTDKLQQVSVVEQEIDLDAPLEEQFPGDEEIVALADVEPEIEVEVAEVVEVLEPEVEEPKNHGQEVSEFAKDTDLEGCEKGQAVAAIASKNKSENDGKNPCDKSDAEEDDGDDGDDAIESVVDDEQDKGQGNGGGNGRAKGKKGK